MCWHVIELYVFHKRKTRWYHLQHISLDHRRYNSLDHIFLVFVSRSRKQFGRRANRDTINNICMINYLHFVSRRNIGKGNRSLHKIDKDTITELCFRFHLYPSSSLLTEHRAVVLAKSHPPIAIGTGSIVSISITTLLHLDCLASISYLWRSNPPATYNNKLWCSSWAPRSKISFLYHL